MQKYLLAFIIAISLLCSSSSYAATSTTTGFIPGPIWYSKETLVEKDTVKIHTVVWNGSDHDLAVRVEFYDQSTVLGTRDVVVPKSELKDVSISWQVTAGDHSISAKIVSSSIANSTKKEQTTVSINETEKDHVFVPVAVKNVDGIPASRTDVIKKQVNQATTDIQNILPEPVTTAVSDNLHSVDVFRDETHTLIENTKDATKKDIDVLDNNSKVNKSTSSKPLDSTQKPIAYVKLFFLSILSFVFGNKIVFYGLCAFLLFIVLRFIYRKIRNR